ncbi:unnamed protein product, partial [Musa textilis]
SARKKLRIKGIHRMCMHTTWLLNIGRFKSIKSNPYMKKKKKKKKIIYTISKCSFI